MSVIECKNVSIRYITGDMKAIGLKEFVTRNKVRKCIFIVYLQRVTTKVASVIVSHKPFTPIQKLLLPIIRI